MYKFDMLQHGLFRDIARKWKLTAEIVPNISLIARRCVQAAWRAETELAMTLPIKLPDDSSISLLASICRRNTAQAHGQIRPISAKNRHNELGEEQHSHAHGRHI